MAGWISLDFGCPDCLGEWDDIIDRDEAASGLYPACPRCDSLATLRRISAPHVMGTALPDSVRRPGFKEKLESLSLEAQSYDMPPDKRGPIEKEIKKLNEVKK